MDISTSDKSLFCTQLVDTAANNFGTTEVLRPTTLVMEDSVYMLVGKYSRTTPPIQGENERGLLLVKGTVTEEDGKNKIWWNETHTAKPPPKGGYYLLTEVVGGGGSGTVMHDGTPIFPMQAKDEDGKSVLLSMRFTPSENKWELSFVVTGKGCRDPSIAEWEENRPFMMAHCDGGYYDVYMSTWNGAAWYPYVEPINRVWGNSRG
ncbi:trans-sialidase, putative [Trypanosoma cruzi marinkellei]|uniref:Trans-sialidase, putative n=1 Tax=Trypanosoma cruzi marinkellei TaxID=85056 RepID=K2N2F5_TRYCR|nr:trans-sialidase, putative [Trypanosoma cruzi marinkellei]